MTSGIEAIGEAMTGAMAARAVEPEAGEKQEREGSCQNCGASLLGPYCHQCGQAAQIHRTLTAFWHDLAHSVLHLDGKIWRTLPFLAWHPGELTRRYVEGERARFVSPMALFLFSVFLMFAIFSATGGPFSSGIPDQERSEAREDFERERAASGKKIAELETRLAEARSSGRPTESLEARIHSEKQEVAIQERTFQLAERLANQEEKREQASPEQAPDGKLDIGIRTGWPTLDKAIDRAERNPSLLLYKVQANAYKFSWALIPLSVPFVWLLFLHRRRYWKYRAYDHTVFVTYSIAFMSLLAITLSLLRPLGLGETATGLALAFVPPIHMYRQLRGAYQLSRFSAIWRTFLLLIFALIASSLFFVLLLMIGVLG